MNIETIKQLLKDDIAKLSDIMHHDLASDIELINQVARHIIDSGGKQIRPLITIICARATGYDDQKHGDLMYKMAAMIEYIHTATLLHDDVVDESDLRRNYKTSNALFGNSASILVGDFIYTHAFQMMAEANSIKLFKLMADSTNKISQGEVLQLINLNKIDVSIDNYLKVIENKTGVLFVAAAATAAIINNVDTLTEHALTTYANNIGIAFQVMDDILDYTGNNNITGKNGLLDLQNGKITLPLIYALEESPLQIKESTIEIITKIRNGTPCALQDICTMVTKNTNAIAKCRTFANHLVQNALEAIACLPESKYKNIMQNIAYFSINRNG